MKDLIQYIKESVSISKFSKATIAAIKENILAASVEFDIENWKFDKFKIFIDNKYIKYSCIMKGKRDTIEEKGDQIFITTDGIRFGYSGHSINCKIKSTYDTPSELVNTSYDEKKNLTCLEFKLKGLRFNSGFSWLYGTIKIYIPTDIMNAKESYSEFDCKGFDKFMETFYDKKLEYHRYVSKDNIIGWSSAIVDNELNITINLQVGKGYGDNHYRTKTYKFEWADYAYNCTNTQLNDRDDEAQIVRKFRAGVQEFTKKHPEKLNIIIQQELD